MALADGTFEISGIGGGGSRKGNATYILVKSGDAWRIASFAIHRPHVCGTDAASLARRRYRKKGCRLNLQPFDTPALAAAGAYCAGLGNRVHLKRDRGLRQQSAVHRGPGVRGDHRLPEDDALEVRGRADGHRAGNLPEDVLGQGAAGEGHARRAALIQRSRHLEDPDIVRAAQSVTSVAIDTPVAHL